VIRKSSSKPKDIRTRNWISKVANIGIIETFSEYPFFRKSYLKRLDFSPPSLKALDELIETMLGAASLSNAKVNILVWGFGGYVAEVLQRNNEGVWKKSKNHYTFEFTRDEKMTGFGVNPWAWTYKRFDEGDLLAPKYKALLKIAKQFYKASATR
jgi:hypothetical protein